MQIFRSDSALSLILLLLFIAGLSCAGSGCSEKDDDQIGNVVLLPPWDPATVVSIQAHPKVRGLRTLRGIIHIHSIYSHDACDNRPWIDGEPNRECFDDLREAICSTNQQFVMITDHAESFSSYDFPDVLLFTPEEGDTLIFQGDDPIGNILQCADGSRSILTAGNENALMPLGMKRMPEGSPAERSQFLRGRTQDTVVGMRDLGAMVFVNHAEGWETEEIRALPVDGIEIYNLHANIDPSIRGDDLGLPPLGFLPDLFNLLLPASEAAHSDLFLLGFLSENRPDLNHWDRLLSGRRVVGVMATDAHRNTLPFPLYDQDRADSYRRMMRWFANYVRVPRQDLFEIEAAVSQGRMYGAFQVFGEPVGFDFYAETGKGFIEMGDQVSLEDGPVLHVKVPALARMEPDLAEPELRVFLIKAGQEEGTVVSQSLNVDLRFAVQEAGAYRAEVRIVPYHLEPWLGDDPGPFFREYPLIYANPIYVGEAEG